MKLITILRNPLHPIRCLTSGNRFQKLCQKLKRGIKIFVQSVHFFKTTRFQ